MLIQSLLSKNGMTLRILSVTYQSLKMRIHPSWLLNLLNIRLPCLHIPDSFYQINVLDPAWTQYLVRVCLPLGTLLPERLVIRKLAMRILHV